MFDISVSLKSSLSVFWTAKLSHIYIHTHAHTYIYVYLAYSNYQREDIIGVMWEVWQKCKKNGLGKKELIETNSS